MTKKINKTTTKSQRTRNKSVTSSQRTRNERATNVQPVRYLFVPLLQQFRRHLRKDFTKSTPQTWIPVECSLLVRYEFATCSLQTRYIFVAILLYCGMRGTDEIPTDARFLSSSLGADARTIEKSLVELEKLDLLRERKKEREEKDRQTESSVVSVDSLNSFQEDSENNQSNENEKERLANKSQFTIEECLKYVELCQSKGDDIKNAKALAMNLFKTGEADAFILSTLYPQQQEEIDRETYGEPRQFSADEPCRVCFGAKMANPDGKGFRKCEHCLDEKGKATGWNPLGENENEQTIYSTNHA